MAIKPEIRDDLTSQFWINWSDVIIITELDDLIIVVASERAEERDKEG